MVVLFKKPRKYTLEIPEGVKAKIINTHTDQVGEDWVTWVQFDNNSTDYGEDTATIKTVNLSQNPDGDNTESLVLFMSDYEKLIGKK